MPSVSEEESFLTRIFVGLLTVGSNFAHFYSAQKSPTGTGYRRYGLREFRRQLEYKAAQRGETVVVVSRWYPSSKTCSACRTRLDRDVNAANNLRHVAESSVGSSNPFLPKRQHCSVTACGVPSVDDRRKP